MFIEFHSQEYSYFPPAFIMTRSLQKLKNISGMNCTWMMKKEQIYFDNYNPSDLENVIERQKLLII